MIESKDFVSVLLPVYNAEKYLAETLCSLMVQTHKNFEIIAVNDGSDDNSLSILQHYQSIDPRIIIIDQKNSGIVASLNRAASIARGEYLARIDGDDTALPTRFEHQVTELRSNPKCVLVASSFDVMDQESGFLYQDAVPTNEVDIRNAMYIRNPIAHGSVMMRKKTFFDAGTYSDSCGPTEDYELWTRLAGLGAIRIINKSLFRWRMNPDGITSTKSNIMEQHMRTNLENYWNENPFRLVTRKQLKSRTLNYIEKNRRLGVAQKSVVLNDLANIAIMLIKRRRVVDGCRQLAVIASTGRTGARVVKARLWSPIKYHLGSREA